MTRQIFAALLALLLVLAACSESDSAGTTAPDHDETTMADDMAMGEDDDKEEGDHSEEFSFGEPAEASEADRVVEITANDDFTFDPAAVTVASGEKVTFRVTNAGVIPHDFTLGDAQMQDEHEAEMAEMGGTMAHEEANVFALEPGETKEMTWHLTGAGEIIFGCHQPGHYAAGMFGTVTIDG